MPRPRRSNPLALAVLVSLYERPMHPYEIAQTLRTRAKHESVRLNYGSLYGVVESLERRGLIQARATVREGRRPERTTYDITDAGAREATDWLTELLAVPQKEFPQFLAGLSFMPALPPDEVLQLLHDRSQALEVRLLLQRSASEAAVRAGLPRIFGIEGEYELAMLDAELAFVRALAKEIEGGSLGGLDLWRSFHADDAGPAQGEVAPRQGEVAPAQGEVAPARRGVTSAHRAVTSVHDEGST